jgi:Flp pilus assembly secretin CpaC
MDRLTAAHEQLRAFLAKAGVDFATNNVVVGGATSSGFGANNSGQPTKAAFFNDLSGTLFVRATTRELDAVENAIHWLNMNTPEVSVMVEIYELPNEEAARIKQDFAADQSLSATNEFVFGSQTNANQSSPILAASKSLADRLKQPTTATNVAFAASQMIISREAATSLRKRLQSAKRIDALTMPNVVTKIGRQARVSLEGTSMIATGTSTNYVGVPAQLGWSVDCIPQSFDGHELQFSSLATSSEFLGYDKHDDIPFPMFRVRQAGSSAKLQPGDSQGLLFPVSKLKRVPVLSDIPNLGQLFQSADESRYTLVLVTPFLIDAAGNRIFPKSEPE